MKIGSPFPTRRLKWMADIRPSSVDKHTVTGDPEVRLCNYTDVYKNDRITDGMPLMDATATEEQLARFTLLPGDVIITKDSETADDIAVPALVSEPLTNVVCGYHLTLLRPKPGVVGAFLFWCLKAAEVSSQMSLAAQGVTRFGITVGGMGRVLMPDPDEETQRNIAEFLDREASKIDALIDSVIGTGARLETNKGFIALLRERRAALVSAAVTGRIDVRGAAKRPAKVGEAA